MTRWILAAVWIMLAACGDPGDLGDDVAPAPPLDAGDQATVDRLRDLIDRADALKGRSGVSAEHRAALGVAAARARAALDRLRGLRAQGAARGAILGGIAATAGGVVADDATVVGVADDWLLIPCAIAALVIRIRTTGPAAEKDLNAAREALRSRLKELRRAVETAAARTATGAARASEECTGRQAAPRPNSRPEPRGTSDVAPAPAEPDTRRRRTCETAFPAVAECWQMPATHTFPGPQAALREIVARTRNPHLRLHNETPTSGPPCPERGMHYNVRAGGERAASITCCECCSDDRGGPSLEYRCRIVW